MLYFTYNSLVLDESLHQLWPQSTEAVSKALWKPRVCVIILWPISFYTTLLLLILFTAFFTLLFSSGCLTFCRHLWAEVGISWEAPEHIQYVEPPVSSQQSLRIHWGEQWYLVTVGCHNNMSLERKRLGSMSQER